MEINEEVLTMLQEYLSYLQQDKSIMDIIVEYYIPIISAVILILSSLAAVIKYYKEKNRDLNEKILNEVYAPLYQYIIKQEYIRHLKPDEIPVDKYPIISLTNTKTKIVNMFTTEQRTIEETEAIFKNTDLLKVTGNINFGLAPHNLLVLLNVYEMADRMHTNVSEDEYNFIETKLRAEIIEGYNEYSTKLGLDRSNLLVKYKDNIIQFDFQK